MTLPESRTRLILGKNMYDPTLKLERGWCTVNNWTLFMHAMTHDDNDECMNVYCKQKILGCLGSSCFDCGKHRAHG